VVEFSPTQANCKIIVEIFYSIVVTKHFYA